MTTIPARLSQVARRSRSPIEQRERVLQLYRDWWRSAPSIITEHSLTLSPYVIRQRIRVEFEKNRYVNDPKVVDILLHKSRLNLQEALNSWQQEPHILGILLQDNRRPQQTFLQKFYEGRDEEAVVPAASGM